VSPGERRERARGTDVADPAGTPMYLVAHIGEALAATPELALLDLEVRRLDHEIVVAGTVDHEEQRSAALRVVRRHADPLPVRDALTVLELHPPPTPEKLR
jgi:hypothetical protein